MCSFDLVIPISDFILIFGLEMPEFRALEMAQLLRELAVLGEDPGLVPSIHTEANVHH